MKDLHVRAETLKSVRQTWRKLFIVATGEGFVERTRTAQEITRSEKQEIDQNQHKISNLLHSKGTVAEVNIQPTGRKESIFTIHLARHQIQERIKNAKMPRQSIILLIHGQMNEETVLQEASAKCQCILKKCPASLAVSEISN